MLALCLDTNTYTAYRNTHAEAMKLIAAVDQLWLPATVLGELRAGFLNGSKSVANELLLRQFMDLPYMAVAPTTEATSRHYAQVSHQLRQVGKPIPANDMWIAACALELGCPLYSFDAHFKDVKGLKVVTSTEDWRILNA